MQGVTEIQPIAVVIALFVVLAVVATLSRRLGVPYPLLMLVTGLLIGFIPGLPHITLTPELVLLLFLPPILFQAAYFTSVRDLVANSRAISLLGVGLVVVTVLAVGIVANWLAPQLGWAAAFALGAIVAPPDAVAATAVARQIHLPRRIVTILEGESLFNDAAALVAFSLAIQAVLTGDFEPTNAALQLVWVAVGGVAIGLVVGNVTSWLLARLQDAQVETLITLIAPFTAYLPADFIGVSGVLAAVVAGLIVGRRAPQILTSESRILGRAVWDIVVFLINGLVFVLIGLELPVVVRSAGDAVWTYLGIALAVSLTVIVVRFAWVVPATYLPRILSPKLRARDPSPPWQAVFVLGYAGMRGTVSIAAALAVPVVVGPNFEAFPGRALLLLTAFVVVLVTLVGQGLSLPWIIARLGLREDGRAAEMEEDQAREATTQAALAHLDGLVEDWPGHLPLINQLRERYRHANEHIGASTDEAADTELIEHRKIRHGLIEAQRMTLIELRDRGEISDEVQRRVERDLDLEELRMEA